MRILLDTHILIWLHRNDERLSQKAREIIRAEGLIPRRLRRNKGY